MNDEPFTGGYEILTRLRDKLTAFIEKSPISPVNPDFRIVIYVGRSEWKKYYRDLRMLSRYPELGPVPDDYEFYGELNLYGHPVIRLPIESYIKVAAVLKEDNE